jgi:ribonuclease P protein component
MNGLKKNKDFSRVYTKGNSRADGLLVLYRYARGDDAASRIGISVSKKVGNSVVRHRIKRRLKEIYRLNEDGFSTGCDYVVIARVRAAQAGYEELERSLLRLMNR